jgi:hypothetical protein
MNATRRLIPAMPIAATLAALVLMQAPGAVAAPDESALPVVHLPAVHVVVQRAAAQPMRVVQLPAVEIVVSRSTPAATLLAQTSARAEAL